MKRLTKRQRTVLTIVIVAIVIGLILWEAHQSNQVSIGSDSNIYYIDNGCQDSLIFTMIDVGQGDAFLLDCGGKFALVDCGPPSGGKAILDYLQTHGISKIDYLFGTHPHDDHMGGMHEVINNVEIGTIIIPEVTLNVSQWYIDLMEELAEKEFDVQLVSVGNRYHLGDAVIEVIGPLSEPSENLNNYSIILKVTLGEMDILMMGDAEKAVEKELLQNKVTVDAEILKVGHHGSSTSSSLNFIKEVNPQYAFISCKVGNRYKHPTKEVMDRLEELGIPVYRTDECGTVTAIITKTDISISGDAGDYLSGPELEEKING